MGWFNHPTSSSSGVVNLDSSQPKPLDPGGYQNFLKRQIPTRMVKFRCNTWTYVDFSWVCSTWVPLVFNSRRITRLRRICCNFCWILVRMVMVQEYCIHLFLDSVFMSAVRRVVMICTVPCLFSWMHQHEAWAGSSNQGIERTAEVKTNNPTVYLGHWVYSNNYVSLTRYHQDWTARVLFYGTMLFQTTKKHLPKLTSTRCMNFSPGFVVVVHQYKGFNKEIDMMWLSRIYRIVLPNDLPSNLWVATQRFKKSWDVIFSCFLFCCCIFEHLSFVKNMF